MANQVKKCVLHGAVNNETVDLYPRTNLASVADMTAFARTLNGAADAAAARKTLAISTSQDIINIIYPVGSVITLTNDTDPNKIYTGTTWVKMDAGRVLVSAGTYTEGSDTYTYTLGDKGGEAKHQLTTEEMPQHSHSVTISSTNINGKITLDDDLAFKSSSGCFSLGDYFTSDLANNRQISANHTACLNDTHSHNATISNTGGSGKHENRQPFTVVSRWYRTA